MNNQENHASTLASWAISDTNANQRKYPEPQHGYRSCFQRDRDRVAHCTAFRRLDFKTQVFVPHQHDHFRTRMTHTLEVALIARTLGRALRLNEDLIEAVALAHDLGHSPFGHGGEEILNKLMSQHGGFEHNRQSLRVVDYLEHPYPDFRGLNLTNVVRECIARHETAYDTPACPDFSDDLQAPLAGQVVDAADEIAYTSADLEDALVSGCISTQQLDELDLWRQAWDSASKQYPNARKIHLRIRACKNVLEIMASDLLDATVTRIEALGPAPTPDTIRHASRKCAGFSEQLAPAVSTLQRFLLDNVYTAGENARRNTESQQIIADLFARYTDEESLLPDRYRRRIDQQGLHRVVCDFIAGMTDRYCTAQHAEICAG
ncbi:MAG: deoxyguanosinetriphosphate triphosphohydrolase [Phycisphaerales bacterium]|jgi:dGTPase|nr:deoxyguanosinetriphosphate triphosphohydrolase [Phycisphaerales bacterium]